MRSILSRLRARGEGPASRTPFRACLPRRLSLSSAFLLLVLTGALPALAGQRHTVWAYPTGAGPKGVVETETWITASRANADSGTASEYRVEIENGITDDISLDVYLAVLTQPPGEPVKFDRVQTSLRADLFREPLNLPVDLTGYFEVKRDLDFGNPWEFEAILIGGKRFGRLEYGFNLVYESELSSKAFQTEVRELKAILTGGYELTHKLWAGGEFIAANVGGTKQYSIGPTVSVVLTDNTWIAVGPQFGLNHDADSLQVRAIFGVFF